MLIKREEWIENFLHEHRGQRMELYAIWNLVPKGHRKGIGITSARSLCQILRKYKLKKENFWSKRERRMLCYYQL